MQGSASVVRSAYAHILFVTAVVEAGGPRQSAAPVPSTRDLPAADDQVLGTSGISGKALALPERQLIRRLCHPHVPANLAVRPVSNRVTDGKVVAVVRIGVGKSVVGQQL